MAEYRLAEMTITAVMASNNDAFDPGDKVSVYWDNVANAIKVYLNGSPFSANETLGEFQSHYSISPVSSIDNTYITSGYSFCSGTTLVWFRMLRDYPMYPYFEKVETANSPVCEVGGGPVCDIHWVGNPIITHATNQTDGGSVQVTAASSNSAVRYGLRQGQSYDRMSNTTGQFTLPPGTWIIYAKDVNDCEIAKQVKVLFKPTDVEHYRFTWKTVKISNGTSRDCRVRIYEREYTGAVVEVNYGDRSPFMLNKPKQGQVNDKFYPVHPTNATLRLVAEEDYQFLPLFTQDNKKFRVVYETDEGSGFTPIWQGFIIPSVYREDFIATPYTVEIQIADNVKSLETEPFTDDDSNLLTGSMKLIKVIAFILKKTGLSLKIRSGVNIFEENHTTAATDDPLDQTYIDVACYRDSEGEPFNCWQVLEAILRPFGARIYQYDNQWIIEEIDRATSEYAYRVFTTDGDYESNSTFDPLVDVKNRSLSDRAAFVNRDQSLEVVPAYGRIDITSKLNYIGSIVSGGFEKTDLLSPETEQSVGETALLKSEEGFRDWTLRLNGTSGVSFGRAVIIEDEARAYAGVRRGQVVDQGETNSLTRTLRALDGSRSVGAFYYLPEEAWSGNLRNAYVESAPKPYQYGPNDALRFKFDHSTPTNKDYPFMTLRFSLKLGTQYLQHDLSWDSTEHIFRAYPNKAGGMQTFELSVATPDTTDIVDTTIQVRIYFYAAEFYDFGLPPTNDNPATGTNGLADMKAFPTTGIDYDYQLETRVHKTIGPDFNPVTIYYRLFSELVYEPGSDAELPDDYDENTNEKGWRTIKIMLENTARNGRLRGLANAFYIDDVAVDSLPGGQPPPEEDTVSLSISKYINENYALELYNFDLPDITNGKNMYNNYFRLSDGTPTARWSRTGLNESLPIQQVLLRVLGSNHSAPTFRMTGSFINEFSRIGINNCIRITKAGSSLSVSNTDFTTDLNGWSQSALPFGTGTWAWASGNGGAAQVTLNSADDSKQLYQVTDHDGGYVEVTVNVKVLPASASNTAEDVMFLLFYRNGQVIHSEKMITFFQVTSESDFDFTHTTYMPGQADAIGFFIKRVSGSSSVTYQVGDFEPVGKQVQEVYQITDYQSDERSNTYFFELMQQSKPYISLSGIDVGGTGQSGGTTGRAHSSAYSTAYS